MKKHKELHVPYYCLKYEEELVENETKLFGSNLSFFLFWKIIENSEVL